MKYLKLLKYFFYLAFNWNIKIAFHIIKNEIRGEKKYGINTTGADELKKLISKDIDISHATIYMPASYDLLEAVFKKTQIHLFKHLVDIGCGKGRSLCVAAYFGAKKLTGIDFSNEFCKDAKLNLTKTKLHFPDINFTIIHNDAFYFEIAKDVDCIFMFNPFDETIMSGVINNINESLLKSPRKITVIYFNPIQKHLFLNNGFEEEFQTKALQYLEAAVYIKNPQ